MVFCSLWPTLSNGFTGYDDPQYITSNPHVNTGISAENLVWAFTTAYASNWHPLTWLSHQLDNTLYHLDPLGHHLTSLLLHIFNTLALFLWLMSATGSRGRSAFVALAFGLHPAHVESVAWVAERKDVLSTLFWMLTLLAYTAYVRRPGGRQHAFDVPGCARPGGGEPVPRPHGPDRLGVRPTWRLRRRAARCARP